MSNNMKFYNRKIFISFNEDTLVKIIMDPRYVFI